MANVDFRSAASEPLTSARVRAGRATAQRPKNIVAPDVAIARTNIIDIRSEVSAPNTMVVIPDRVWPERSVYGMIGKRAFDIALVIAAAPLYVPLIAASAFMLMWEGGNPFYVQDRLGRGGNRFKIVKLRTMVRDADKRLAELIATDPAIAEEWEVTQKLKNDPRVTPTGEFLRRTSLDELPQLWNVLTGEMSLVGPRPMMPDQLPLYGDPKHYFAMRPGISGLWQVEKRNESSFASRNHFDEEYAQTVSFFGDLGVLWKTIGVVLKRTGC